MKRTKGIMRINSIEWVKKIMARLLVYLRQEHRRTYRAPSDIGSCPAQFAMPFEARAWYKKRAFRLPLLVGFDALFKLRLRECRG
jgi:hypothetical protein